MTYYLIGESPSTFEEFQNRLPLLGEAAYVEDMGQLENILGNSGAGEFFFLVLHELVESEEKLVLHIREHAAEAKVIYLIHEKGGVDLKSHQASPFGGDAYLPFKAGPEDLNILLEDLCGTQIIEVKNRLEQSSLIKFVSFEALDNFKNQTVSRDLDTVFRRVIENKPKKTMWQSLEALNEQVEDSEAGVEMSTNEKDLPSDELGDFDIEIGELNSEEIAEAGPSDEGMELSFDNDLSIDLASADEDPSQDIHAVGLGEISLDEVDELPPPPADEIALDVDEELSFDIGQEDGLVLGSEEELNEGLSQVFSLKDEEKSFIAKLQVEEDLGLDLGEDFPGLADEDSPTMVRPNAMEELSASNGDGEFSEEAQEKLKEIDAIMDFDASRVIIQSSIMAEANEEEAVEDILDQPLVSEDLDLDSLNFDSENLSDEDVTMVARPLRKKKEEKLAKDRDPHLSRDLKELSGAYSGEMERLQATISNLRSDRAELLEKIDSLEDEKVIQNRQSLSLRAELDERKIELTIIRKKLHEELNDMKDKFKLFEEKRLILEEKNRQLMQELDTSGHRNRIDVKKVQMRERELEQKLELLKSDAETQIKHRDLKILELKRKIDGMEFDMESISSQEKRSVESRYELEDKLDKAIKTLRNAITVLEDESDRSNALKALKKNIDM